MPKDIELLRKQQLIDSDKLMLTQKAIDYLLNDITKQLVHLDEEFIHQTATELNELGLESLLLKVHEDNQIKESKWVKFLKM